MKPNTRAIAVAALLFGLSACSKTEISQERYPDGARKSQSAFIRLPHSAAVRHGIQLEWYPSGEKSSLETYVNGYLQGYSLRWHPNGRMKSVEHYTDGVRDGRSKSWDEAGNLIACSAPDECDASPGLLADRFKE